MTFFPAEIRERLSKRKNATLLGFIDLPIYQEWYLIKQVCSFRLHKSKLNLDNNLARLKLIAFVSIIRTTNQEWTVLVINISSCLFLSSSTSTKAEVLYKKVAISLRV